jgi:biotin-(acetyl-CoA carboxylase) ligase
VFLSSIWVGGIFGNFFKISVPLAMIEAIYEFSEEKDVGLRIKWPNDIYFENKKVAGVIVSTNFIDGALDLIIGLGK